MERDSLWDFPPFPSTFSTLQLLYPLLERPKSSGVPCWSEFSAESGTGCNLPTSNVSISVGPGQGESPVSPPHSPSTSGYLWKTRDEDQSWTLMTQPRLWSGSGSWGSRRGG